MKQRVIYYLFSWMEIIFINTIVGPSTFIISDGFQNFSEKIFYFHFYPEF